jgi:hypothetical protein
MQMIELDASTWKTALDFCDALRDALDAPFWHGDSVDAFIDSMIYGGINGIEPPYTVRVRFTKEVPAEVREAVETLQKYLSIARQEHRVSTGEDVDVRLEIVF